uniref:Scol-BPFTx n=1 Tax=Scolopendra viridis TaxID=118503 RepID=A0A4D5R942_SCOVI
MFQLGLSLVVVVLNFFTSNAYLPAIVKPDQESVYKWKFRDTVINLIEFENVSPVKQVPLKTTKESIGKLHRCFSDAYPTPNNNLPRLQIVLTTAIECMAKELFGGSGVLNWIEFNGKNDEMKLASYRKFKVNVKRAKMETCINDPAPRNLQSQVVLNIINRMSNPISVSLLQSKFEQTSIAKYKTYSSSTQYEYKGGFSIDDFLGLPIGIGGGIEYTYTTEDHEQSKDTSTSSESSEASIKDTYEIHPKTFRKFISTIKEIVDITTKAIPIIVKGHLAFSLKDGSFQNKNRWILSVAELAKIFNVFQVVKGEPDKVMIILTFLKELSYIDEESEDIDSNLGDTSKVIELCQERKQLLYSTSEI